MKKLIILDFTNSFSFTETVIDNLKKLKEKNYLIVMYCHKSDDVNLNSELFTEVKYKDQNHNINEVAKDYSAELIIVVTDENIINNTSPKNVYVNYIDKRILNIFCELVTLVSKIEIAHQIEKKIDALPKDRAKIIAINGVDTSGKTAFASFLNQYFLNKQYKTQNISIDEFHNPSSIRYSGDNPIDSYIDHAFNLKQLIQEVLKPIYNKKTLNKQLTLLNLDTDSYTYIKDIKIDKDTIVIIEGVLLYRPPLEDYLDIKVFLDITFDEVLRRAKIRDVPKYGEKFLDKYKNKYIPIQKKYLKEYDAKHKSDLIINNNDFNKPKLANIKRLNDENTKRRI